MNAFDIMLLELRIAHPRHSGYLDFFWHDLPDSQKEEFFMSDWKVREISLSRVSQMFLVGDYKA